MMILEKYVLCCFDSGFRCIDGFKEIIASRNRGRRTRLMMGLPRVFGRDWAQRMLKVFVGSIAVKR